MGDVNATAATGFGREAQRYARSRPDYPEALLAWLADPLGVVPGATALDLGAGTGKFTRLLVRAGATVIAIEPVAQMREQLAATLAGVATLAATAQAMPLANASIDAVVCAQAFHWFANPASLAEIHRVLQPGGRLGLIWNVRDESVDWVHEITRLITPHEGDLPRYHNGAWRRAFGDGLFSEPELSIYPYVHAGDPEAVIIERFASVSFIAAMNEADKNRMLDQLRTLVTNHPALRGRSRVEFPYQTHAYCCRRLAGTRR
ncbi:MAG: methyltransferase domain-containing protein [Steroidobacteraceae bacterium]|jgi:SAM-dependent methyltransferase